MSQFSKRALPFLMAVALFATPLVYAQSASSERVIRSWVDQVKLDDGTEIEWTYTVTFNTDSGEYVKTIVEAYGELVERTVDTVSFIRPSEEEMGIARDLIFADTELSALFNNAERPLLSGGFVLAREEGHPCGPRSRCIQFDMMNVLEADGRAERIRYIIVDLRTESLVSTDFNPDRDGNETRFNVDRRSN